MDPKLSSSKPKKKNDESLVNKIVEGYRLEKKLGKGSFAEVYSAKKGSEQYAIKCIDKQKLKDQPHLKEYLRTEIISLQKVKSENTVELIEKFEDDKFVYIVTELCDSDLLQYLLDNKQMSESDAKNAFFQILKGMRAIHEKGYVHRDLKPQNILITQKGGKYIFKIADFGFAKEIGKKLTQTQCGTNDFMAPEILQREKYNYKVDIWSLGVMLYSMIFRCYPFASQTNSEQIEKIKKQTQGNSYDVSQNQRSEKYKIIAQDLSNELKNLFKKIFVIKPKYRIDYDELMNHSWLKDFQDQDELLREQQKSAIFYQSDKSQALKKEIEEDKQQVFISHDEEYKQENFNQNIFQPDISDRNMLYSKQQPNRNDEIQKSVRQEQTVKESLKNSERQSQKIEQNGEIEDLLNQEFLFKPTYEKFYYERSRYIFVRNFRQQIQLLEQKYFDDKYKYALDYFLLKVSVFLNNSTILKLTGSDGKEGGFDKSKLWEYLFNQLSEDQNEFKNQQDEVYKLAFAESKNDAIIAKNITLDYKESKFDDFKVPYRKVLYHHIFQMIENYKTTRDKQYVRLCLKILLCHLINRVFEQGNLKNNFPHVQQKINDQNHHRFIEILSEWADTTDDMKSVNTQIESLLSKYFPKRN